MGKLHAMSLIGPLPVDPDPKHSDCNLFFQFDLIGTFNRHFVSPQL